MLISAKLLTIVFGWISYTDKIDRDVIVFYILKGSQVSFPNYDVFLSLKKVVTLINNVVHDKMLHFVAIHPCGISSGYFTLCQSAPLGVSRIQRVTI